MRAKTCISCLIVGLCISGCLPVFESTYVPTTPSDQSGRWVCGGLHRPEFVFNLSNKADLVVSTIDSTIYLNVVTEADYSVDLDSNILTIQSPADEKEDVDLIRQSWNSEELRKRHGLYYQYFTGRIKKLSEEKSLTFSFPKILIEGQSYDMEPTVFEKRSRMGWNGCGYAW